MKFISWNVNGLRACVNKGFLDHFYQLNADFFCIQETKLQEGQIDLQFPGYYQYWNYAQKKGYSGTAIFTKHKPLSVKYGVGVEELDTEGRLITLEYEEFYLVTCYTPNAQRELARIDHRMRWEDALRDYLIGLDRQKPVIYCGDLNVAHQEIDLKNPASNRGNAGFSDQERNAFSKLLESGFTDTFRYLYPDVTGAYSWWSYMFKARQNNAGWRIDYFIVSDRLRDSISEAQIFPDIMGSDHCPVGLEMNITCNGSIWSPVTTIPDPPEKADADSNKTVGTALSILKGAVVSITLFAIILTGIFFIPRSLPKEETVVSPTEASAELIADVQCFSNNAEHVTFDDEPQGSYFRVGMKLCRSVEPLVDWSQYQYEQMPTFFAMITFSDEYTFTKDNLPQVQYPLCKYDMYFYRPYITHQFYYGNDDTVEGVLILADVPEDRMIDVTIRYANQISTCSIQLTANRFLSDYRDYSTYTTAELVDILRYNGILRKLSYKDTWPYEFPSFDLNYFIEHNACAKELFRRKDALDELLNALTVQEADPTSSHIPIPHNILALLKHEQFQSQMTDDQRRLYEIWDIEQEEHTAPIIVGDILYGEIYTSVVIDENP